MRTFRKTALLYLILPLILMACSNEQMTFELKEHLELEEIPSASGIEVLETGIFIIGDNSPWLFRIGSDYKIKDRFWLLPEGEEADSLIEKMKKPDFEALTKADDSGERLFIFGSGSKSPERDVLVEVTLGDKGKVENFSLEEFYQQLRLAADLSPEEQNIEAAEVYKEHLYLFNRGKNLVLKYSLGQFNSYIRGGREVPVPEVYRFTLPEINGIESGFSGAGFNPASENFIFTSTVEDTSNWIDDGEVLGSFIGVIHIDELTRESHPASVAIAKDGEHLTIKVESVSVVPPFNRNEADLLLVTDSDGGKSEILRGILRF